MNSEKMKEIKKALEQNDDNGIMYEVNDQKRTCKFIHHKDILTLINELESENERLTTENVNYYGAREQTIEDLAEIINKQKDRIAELEKQMCRNEDLHTTTEKLNDIIILKQFAERLKDKIGDMKQFFRSCLDRDYCGLTEDQIDETLKELI